MAKLLRCRACGFVVEEGHLGEVCPACGLPRKVFEEHAERISPLRKRILALDLHPISVHLPQSLAVLILLALLGKVLLRGPLAAQLEDSARLLAILFPLTVLASMATGLLDGRTRYRRLRTPLLVRKMIVGLLLLLLSAALAALALLGGFGSPLIYLGLALVLGCLVCEFLLGRTGSKLICPYLRG
ncbi:MAG: rubrerythrin [Candidatus Eisenbacteria bacterium]|nr:rubrerythrin [Candidatus Eisenbacteria bacterium]